MSFVMDRQSQQVRIRDLPITLQTTGTKGESGLHIQFIGPEHVTRMAEVGDEQIESFAHAHRVRRNGQIRGEPNESGLRDRATVPTAGCVGPKPGADPYMMFVGRPE